MKVFISWSGESSRKVAEALQDWLPRLINVVEPWISTEMGKGVRWSEEIAAELDSDAVGLLCLTRDNLDAPWIHYEAGALSKTRGATVWTYLIGLHHSDVKPPLAQFNHTLATKDDTRRLIGTINDHVGRRGEKALQDDHLDDAFEYYWPKLEHAIGAAVSGGTTTEPPRRVDDMIVEILGLVRTINDRGNIAESTIRAERGARVLPEAQLDSEAVAALIERMIAAGEQDAVRLPLDYFQSRTHLINVMTLLDRRGIVTGRDDKNIVFHIAPGGKRTAEPRIVTPEESD